MCLILLSYRNHPEYPLIIAANRDEFYDRLAIPAQFWEKSPDMLAGRDLKEGGTWLGITKRGRIAMITNYREPGSFNPNAPTRGGLVSDYLSGSEPALTYLEQLRSGAQTYNGYNLILGDDTGLYYSSNRTERVTQLSSGVYGLSNQLLNTPWPKVSKSKKAFVKALEGREVDEKEIFDILSDDTPALDEQLPDTGVGIELERMLSPVFIKSPKYGTRCSTVILMDKNSQVNFVEKTYEPVKEQWSEVRFNFTWNIRL